jgi:hypothetical protein
MPFDIDLSVTLYSSVCPPLHLDDGNWGYVNHILNNKIGDHWDIATALWSFINHGPTPETPTANANTMIANAIAAGPGWTPVPGQVVAVICDPPVDQYGDREYQYLLIEVEVPPEYCYSDYTGWAQGPPYNPGSKRNWAMYVEFEPSQYVDTIVQYGRKNAELLDSQVIVEPSMANPGNVKITISLPDDWYIGDKDGFGVSGIDSVKIQDYAKAPSGNPAPGKFEYHYDYFGSTFECENVPMNNYYGIHIDLTYEHLCYNSFIRNNPIINNIFQNIIARFPNMLPLLQLLLK